MKEPLLSVLDSDSVKRSAKPDAKLISRLEALIELVTMYYELFKDKTVYLRTMLKQLNTWSQSTRMKQRLPPVLKVNTHYSILEINPPIQG